MEDAFLGAINECVKSFGRFEKVRAGVSSYGIRMKDRILLVDLIPDAESLHPEAAALYERLTSKTQILVLIVINCTHYFFFHKGKRSEVVKDNLSGIKARIGKWAKGASGRKRQ